MMPTYKYTNNKGTIIIIVLVFSAVFLMLFSGLLGFVSIQYRQSVEKAAWNKALAIAEAGVNYYRWHLAHDPEDLTDGTGGPGPYEHVYVDPESGSIGRFSLEIQGEERCGRIGGISITSTGWTDQFPSVKRKIQVKYVRPTVADFAYLLNDNVWAGADREIKGPYHSNGGIRMDGENNSLVTSARETWLCTESFGCNPPETKPGVFGDGENSDLWRFPVPPFNFEGITMDLAEIKSLTKDQGQGLYFPPSGNEGYHAILKSNRTMDLYNVTAVDDVRAYDLEQGWYDEYSVVTGESFLGNYPIPGDCGLVFLEDDVWVSKIDQESSVKGKITLVSADLINPNAKSSVWLNGSVEYTTQDGSDGLVLVAQENNLIGLYVPDNMALEGVFIAQNGRFGRNYYPSTYSPYYMREKLEVYGSIVSNGREGTKWSCGGVYCSGFEKRENTYNPQLSFDPPPFLPATSEEYELKEWRETQ